MCDIVCFPGVLGALVYSGFGWLVAAAGWYRFAGFGVWGVF